MPRCRDTWVRRGDTDVGVKVTCDDSKVFYSLSYNLLRVGDELAVRQGEDFTSDQLSKGVEWTVPEGFRCELTLVTTSNKALDTEIKLNGVGVECHAGRHCQGKCTPSGAAGIAGDWAVTAARRPS